MLGVYINDAGAGSVDLGTRGYTSGTVTGAAIANNLSVASAGAVTSGLTLTWSSGPVEGRVNYIKMIKRQMFGRAGLPLLRKRVLLTAQR